MKCKLRWQVKVGLALFLIAAVLFCTGMAAAQGWKDAEYEPYCVKPGDTLWSIAKECPGSDIRKTVWMIQKKNGMEESAIYVGDLLYIPVEN